MKKVASRSARVLPSIDRSIPWEIKARARDMANAMELERQLDAEILRAKTWSAEWWKLLRQMDRVRTQLISWYRNGLVSVGRSSGSAKEEEALTSQTLKCPKCDTLLHQGPTFAYASIGCPKCGLVLDRA